MALLTCSTNLSTTFGSSESSKDKSIELSSAKSCFSCVTGGGFHAGTDGLPGRSAAGGLKGAEGAMMKFDRMICRRMFLGYGVDADESYHFRSSAALSYIFSQPEHDFTRFPCKAVEEGREGHLSGLLNSTTR